MALRYLSIDLYEQYRQNPNVFQLYDSISYISILNCKCGIMKVGE